ncbi:hypothetical protein H8356DRAFT_1431840 [Neocallimastix lanati (nom. inval.)]|nr:hypothetical protein H8356DRAFT_1431840 [Neocallimastix sp. JGI-2020a]
MESHEVYDFLNTVTKNSKSFPLTSEQIRDIYNFLNEKLVGREEFKDFLFINNPTAYRKKTKIDENLKKETENKIEYNSSELGKICGCSFKPGDTVYRCCDCAFDNTCVLCSKCFHASNHKGHNIKFYITKNGGGCCDCGDEEAFLVDIGCKFHNVKNDMNGALKPLPEPLKRSLKSVISQCFTFIIDVLNKSPFEISVPKNDEDIRKEESEDGSDKLYDCLIWNDEVHSFDIVITKLKEATGCSNERAELISKNVDSHGRGCLCISEDIAKLRRMSDIINEVKLRTTIRLLSETLKEEVVAYLVVYFSKLLKVVPGIISINDEKYESVKDVIRDIINHEFFRKIEDPSKYNHPKFIREKELTIIDLLFYYDIKIWKSTRILIKELYINTLISDQEFKVKTADKYATHFPYILNFYISDIEDNYNIIDFMVQTISPTSVNYLFTKTDFYYVLMRLIKTNIFCNSGHLQFSYKNFLANFELLKSLKTSKYEFNSLTVVNRFTKGFDILSKSIEGVVYLLQAPNVKTNYYRENLSNLQCALDTLIYLQGYFPQICYIDYHIDSESNDWVNAVEYTFVFGKLLNCIAECYKYDPNQPENLKYIKKAMTHTLSFLDEWCYYKSRKKIVRKIIRRPNNFISTLLNLRQEAELIEVTTTELNEINGVSNSDNQDNSNSNSSSSLVKPKQGFHFVKSLDGQEYEVPKYSIMFGEMSFIYPVHWLFSYFVRQLPDILRNLTEEEKNNGSFDRIWDDIFSFYPITEGESDTVTKENRIQRLMEYPLRCMTTFSQIYSNLWIRNGLTIYQMASTYSNVKLRSISYETNIIFLQVASLVLDSNLFLTSLLDRFEIMDWFRGKSYEQRRGFSNEKVNLLVGEFLLFIIKLLTFRKEINGKGFIGNLRNEIIHLLIKKPLSFSEISSRVEKRYAQLEKDITSKIEDILKEVSNFKFPYGIADRGTYELKSEYYDEADPWFYSLSFNDRETAKQKIKEYALKTSENKNESIENIVLKPRMEPIDPTSGFAKLPNLCRSKVFNGIIFHTIWNITREKSEDDEVKEEIANITDLLDEATYLIEVAIEEEKRCAKANTNLPVGHESFIWNAAHQEFTIAAKSIDSKVNLTFDDEEKEEDIYVENIEDAEKVESTENMEARFSSNVSMNDPTSGSGESKTINLISWLIYLIEKSDTYITNFIPRLCAVIKDVGEMTDDKEVKEYIEKWVKQKYLKEHKQQLLMEKEEEENKLKKMRAKARKAELMAQFAQQQNNFMMNTNFDFDDDEFENEDYEYNEEEIKTQHIYQFPVSSCIMCRESNEGDDNLIGMLGYAQTSCHVRQVKFNDCNDVFENLQMNFSFDQEQERSTGNTVEESKEISVLPPVSPVHSQSGIYVSTCGHMMHSKCLEKYVDTIARDQQNNPRRNYSVNIKHNEFLCPFCKNICNVLLPVVWKDKHYTIRNFESQEGDQEISHFSQWLDDINRASLTGEAISIYGSIEKFNNEYIESVEKKELEGGNDMVVKEKSKENHEEKGIFELKSFVNSDFLKKLCEDKIIKTLQFIKKELLHEKVKSIDESTLLTNILHETFKYTIQTIEVMMRGTKQDSSSESTIMYPFIGLIEHANPKILNLLRIINEIILTYTAIKIQDKEIRAKHLKRAIKLGQMIFGKKLIGITSSMELDNFVKEENNQTEDESEYFSANMSFDDGISANNNDGDDDEDNEDDDDDNGDNDNNNFDGDINIPLDTNANNNNTANANEPSNNNTITDSNVATANENEDEDEDEDEEGSIEQIEIDNEQDQEIFGNLNIQRINNGEDDNDDENDDDEEEEEEEEEGWNYINEDDDNDDDEARINEGGEYFDDDYLYSFGSRPKTKDIEIKCEKKKLLHPIEEDTFALFVSSTFYLMPKDSDVSNWTMLFYTMELVKCLLAIAESVGVMENQWPNHPKIRNIIKKYSNDEASKVFETLKEKGKEKGKANEINGDDDDDEIDVIMATSTTNSPIKDHINYNYHNLMNDNDESKPISSLLYTILDILHVHPDIKKRCKISLSEEILSYALKIFTKPFLRQAVLLIYSRFFITPEAVELDNQELNEYDRNLKFLNLPSTLFDICKFINNNSKMKEIIKHWCDQWCETLKMNPFEVPVYIYSHSGSSILSKRERKADSTEHITNLGIGGASSSSSSIGIAVANDNGLMLEPISFSPQENHSNNNNNNNNNNSNNNSNNNNNISTTNKTKSNTSSIHNTKEMVSSKNVYRFVNPNQFESYKIKLNSASIIEMFPLPNKISDLIEECSHRKCKRCNSVPYIQTICLLCGEMVCFQSYCCIKDDYGECYLHSQTCGKGTGMYILIKKCMVYINSGSSGQFLNAPYLDIHGEPDESYLRGKPQYLSPRRYEELRKMWLHKSIPSYIAQRLENTVDYGGWETL